MIVSDILLSLLLVCVAGHSCHLLLLKYFDAKLPRLWRDRGVLWYPPTASVCLSVAVVIASALTRPKISSECLQDSEINADIGGIGVLLGLFLPTAVIVLVLFSGHWKAETSGAKELCMAHMANLLYLTVNLAKSSRHINVRDTLVACSSIDAISASVSMAASDKDVLAARKLVVAGYILQVPAFIVEGVTLSQISRLSTDCLAELGHPTMGSSKAIMWTYLAVRILAAFSLAPTVQGLIQRLNEFEHAPRQSLQVKNARIWETLPATLFTNYLVFGSLALVQIVPTFSATQITFSRSAEKLRTEWGQSAALIVAVVSVSHVAFSNYQLFRSEAMSHRLEVCRINGTKTSWAGPQWTWKTGFLWKFLMQRSPFGKIVLRPTDELLVDTAQILRQFERNLTTEEQDALWEKLQDGFSSYDVTYVLDCLNQGAPVNRMTKDNQEYPVHMAARFGNLEILQRIQPPALRETLPFNTQPSEDLSRNGENELKDPDYGSSPSNPHHRLVSENSDKQTPLGLAISANRAGAARWILLRMKEIPPTSARNFSKARISVVEGLKAAICAEKILFLEIMVELWPEWKKLILQQDDLPYLPLQFALKEGKPRSAAFILRHHPHLKKLPHPKYTLFNYQKFWRALDDNSEAERLGWFNFMWQKMPRLATDKGFRSIGLANNWTVSLIAMGWEPTKICELSVNRTTTGGQFLMRNLPPKSLSSLPSETLDYVLSNVKGASEDAIARWKLAGARDWSDFLAAAAKADKKRMTVMIAAELSNKAGETSRMVNAIWSGGKQGDLDTLSQRVLTRVALSTEENCTADINDSVQLLLQHGASVLRSSIVANSSLMDTLTNARKDLVHEPDSEDHCLKARQTTLQLVLEAAGSQDANREPGTDSALHIACKAFENNYRTCCERCVPRCLDGIQTLLNGGCDPRNTNANGITPRDILVSLEEALPNLGEPFTITLRTAIKILRDQEGRLDGSAKIQDQTGSGNGMTDQDTLHQARFRIGRGKQTL